MSDKQVWHIFKCCTCHRFVDGLTRQIVPKPNGIVMSHGYCQDCAQKVMKELEAEAGKAGIKQHMMANSGIRYGLLCRGKGGEVE